MNFQTLLSNGRMFLIGLDRAANCLVCTLTFQQAYDETMSAHAWRAYRDEKIFGHAVMPVIDWMFSWQKQDPAYVDENGQVITGHCRRAYLREKARVYLPTEYREETLP